MTWSYDATTQSRFMYKVFIERWFLWLCHGTAQMTGHKGLYDSRPSGAGGMALFPRPCDLSVTPTLVFLPANPAMFRRFRSLPKIGGFKLTQGFSSIFNRPYTALFHLMSATFADELSATPRAGYQQVYAATPSCPELDLIRTDLTGNVRMFRSVFLWNTLHNFLY